MGAVTWAWAEKTNVFGNRQGSLVEAAPSVDGCEAIRLFGHGLLDY